MDKAIDWSQYDAALDRAASKVAEYARQGAKRDGVAIYYKDNCGRWLKEYPDGRRMQVVEFKGRDGEKEIPLV